MSPCKFVIHFSLLHPSFIVYLIQLVRKCNETTRSMERMERMLTLCRKLDFSEVRRTVPLVSASRWLVRESDVDFILGPEVADSSTSRSISVGQRQPHCLLLFTDMLIIARRQRLITRTMLP